MTTELTSVELNALHRLEYLVAEAFDNHDVEATKSLIADTLEMNFDDVGHNTTKMTKDEYLEFLQSKIWADAEHIRHQSFLGAGYYEKRTDDCVIGRRQTMTVYVMHKDHEHGEVESTSHGLGMRETIFRKINGEWKWAGNTVKIHAFGQGYEKLPHAKKHMPADRKQWHKIKATEANGSGGKHNGHAVGNGHSKGSLNENGLPREDSAVF